ncbi:unnamed protein product [Cercospora beticola]|nr:unnamed protein product [Cercospora beticola]
MGVDDFTALEPPSMKGEQKRRQDSAFATSTQDSTGLEPDAGFDIERRRKKAKLATEEPQVWLSAQGNLRTGMPGPSTPPIATRVPAEPQASAAPKALFATPMEFFTSSSAFARPRAAASPGAAGSSEAVASPEAAASPDRAISPGAAASSQVDASPPASASPEPLPASVSNTTPLQDTATPGPSNSLSSIQTQASAIAGLPSASTSNAAAPQAAADAPPTTRQVSLHRDMTPYVGARPIPQWLTDLAREIRAADTDPQGRPKTAALKKVTNTFVRDGQTLSHFSPASGVLRVGARWSPLWEWWMDTRVLTPAQWWRVNEVDWKMKSEGYKELPNGCYGVNVAAV